METYGTGIFDNDVARRFVGKELWDISYLERAVLAIFSAGVSKIYVENAQFALAACEIIARAQSGMWERNEYTTGLDLWLEETKPEVSSRLARMAVAAIDCILIEPSQILHSWPREEDFVAWKQNVERLKARIRT